MRARGDREEPVRETGAENMLELQALGLVHGHDLDRVSACGRRLGVIGGRREHRSHGPGQIRQQRFLSVQPLVHVLDALEPVDRAAEV